MSPHYFRSPQSLMKLFPFLGATTSMVICLTHPEWSMPTQNFLLIAPVILIVWRLLRVISQHSLSGVYWVEVALLTIGVQEEVSQNSASNFYAKSAASSANDFADRLS
jgi:hypothetical protein